MKHNLFRNFTALLLSGTMLAGAGCKDYDDDIDNINKRLDGMEVTISSLPEQLEAIKASIPDLTSLTSRVEALEGKLEGVTDLKGQLDELKGLESTLKQYVDDEIGKATTADALKATLGNYFATAEALSDLEETLTKAGGSIDQAIQEAVNEIQGDITDLKNNVGDWMGPQMKEYLDAKGYATKSTTITEATSAAAEEILTQIKAEQSDYRQAIEEIVAGATISKLGTGVVKKENLDTELQELIEKIEPLINRVAELEGRIQSLVYVPSSLEEAQSNTIMFEGASWINFSGTKYYLGLADKQTAIITFRVSPASLVEKITDENISIVTEKITRAAAFTAELIEDSADPETGKFQVRATTDYKYGETANETLAIALNVKIAPAEGSESKYGIDYTTSFIGTDYTAGGDITAKLVIAKEKEDGSFDTPTGQVYASELKYNSTETVTFMEDFDVYYNPETNEYHKLSDMWENAPKITIKKPTKAATIAPETHKTNYTVSATTAAIKTSSTDLIGETITSELFTYSISANNKTLEIGKAKQQITIVGDNTDTKTVEAAKLHWQYAIANSDAASRNVYVAENVALDNALKAAIYNDMKTYTENASLEAGKYTISITENGTTASGITPAIELVSTPSVDTDAQLVKITLTGDLKKTANYVVKAVYMHQDKTTATIIANVNVTGMPEIAAYEIPAAEKTYVGEYEFVLLQNYASVLWNDNLKDAFGDKTTFENVIYGATANATKAGKADLAKDNQNIKVTFDNDAVYGTAYKPSIKFTDAKETGFAVTFKSTVTLVELEAEMKVNSAYINSEGKATASTDLTSSVFKVLDKEIAGAYYYDGEYADKTTVVYSINESADDLKAIEDAGGTAPSISSDVLTWADWNKLELKVKAELTTNDRVLDTKEFVVTIADPVAEAITADSEVDATIYAGETDKTFAVPSMLKLAAQKGSAIDAATNVFDAAGAAMGLNDDLKTALTGKATYTLAEGTNPIITISADGKGILTLADSALEINEFSVTVKVTYKYQFGERTFDATIKVKPGTKPVVTPAP